MRDAQFSFTMCLRHAFMTGAGYTDLDKISEADQARWAKYNPPITGAFATVDDALKLAKKVSSPVSEEMVFRAIRAMAAAEGGDVTDEEFEAAKHSSDFSMAKALVTPIIQAALDFP